MLIKFLDDFNLCNAVIIALKMLLISKGNNQFGVYCMTTKRPVVYRFSIAANFAIFHSSGKHCFSNNPFMILMIHAGSVVNAFSIASEETTSNSGAFSLLKLKLTYLNFNLTFIYPYSMVIIHFNLAFNILSKPNR